MTGPRYHLDQVGDWCLGIARRLPPTQSTVWVLALFLSHPRSHLFKDKVNYRLAAVAGNVLVRVFVNRDHLGGLVKVAYVDFEHNESQGNPCLHSPTSWPGKVCACTPHYRISS